MIHIVGTHHDLQSTKRPDDAIERGYSVEQVEEMRARFAAFIRSLVIETSAALIAEELLECVLAHHEADSTLAPVAAALSIEHSLCDLPNKERFDLDLLHVSASWPACPERDRLFHEKEKHWLGRIKHRTENPIIFVCGEQHTRSFRNLLSAQAIPSRIEVQFFGEEIYGSSR